MYLKVEKMYLHLHSNKIYILIKEKKEILNIEAGKDFLQKPLYLNEEYDFLFISGARFV